MLIDVTLCIVQPSLLLSVAFIAETYTTIWSKIAEYYGQTPNKDVVQTVPLMSVYTENIWNWWNSLETHHK